VFGKGHQALDRVPLRRKLTMADSSSRVSNAAKLLGPDNRIGMLRAGMPAEVVAVARDPTQNTRTMNPPSS
jgi:predicted amidohydrolase YtcJ